MHAVYKIEEIVHVGVRSQEQTLWERSFPELLLCDIIDASMHVINCWN